jgi:glycosyltransferase involved in cell wall biosynthesis
MTALHEARPFADAILDAARRPARVGFLTPHNPHDRTSFSGTAHHAFRALSARADLDLRLLGGHRPARASDRLLRRFRPARQVTVAPPDLAGLDIVVGLTATSLLADFASWAGVPFIHVTDAVPSFLRQSYGWTIPPEADAAEQRVIAGSVMSVYSSRYMARRAVQDFGTDAFGRTTTIPFGMNLDTLPDTVPAKPLHDMLRLLWVGSEWTRKGGPQALAAFDVLRNRGVPAHLVMVGDVPATLRGRPDVTVTGYLDKNRPRDLARLTRLYAEAHVLLLPSRADCTPMVVAEANAHGTPVIASDVGGIGALMDEGRNGTLLPLSAGPQEWANTIRAMTRDPDAFAALGRSSHAHARTRLTWDAWARDMAALIHSVTATMAPPRVDAIPRRVAAGAAL